MKITVNGARDLRPIILAALDAGRFTVSMKTELVPGVGAMVEPETVFVDVLGVIAPVGSVSADGIGRAIEAAADLSGESVDKILSERDELRGRLVELEGLVKAFSDATIGPNEDPIENLGRWTGWAREGRVFCLNVRDALPTWAIREHIEAQVPDDEDAQMAAYMDIVSFIDQRLAEAKKAPAQMAHRPPVEPPPAGFELPPGTEIVQVLGDGMTIDDRGQVGDAAEAAFFSEAPQVAVAKSDGVVSSEVSHDDDAEGMAEIAEKHVRRASEEAKVAKVDRRRGI